MKYLLHTLVLGLLLSFQTIAQSNSSKLEKSVSGLKLREIGPASMGGRISDIAIHPEKPYMALFKHEQCFMVRFPMHHRDEIHPDQALVEVFNLYSPLETGLLELEYHSPYVTLEPGASFKASQEWIIHSYYGPSSRKGHNEFLEKLDA